MTLETTVTTHGDFMLAQVDCPDARDNEEGDDDDDNRERGDERDPDHGRRGDTTREGRD